MAHPFDVLAQDLAQGVSRREALRRLGGGLVGAVLVSIGLAGEVWGAPRAECRSRCKALGATGKNNKQCMDVCLSSSCPSANCVSGPAGNVSCCGSDQTCSGGACICRDSTETSCGSYCTDTTSDPNNCGGCAGVGGDVCGGSTPICCSGTCTNTRDDENNCGGCGSSCDMGQVCTGGSCCGARYACVNECCLEEYNGSAFLSCSGTSTSSCPSGAACFYGTTFGDVYYCTQP
jgi:hypothetical protein